MRVSAKIVTFFGVIIILWMADEKYLAMLIHRSIATLVVKAIEGAIEA
jgi:hypothetical protein